MKVMVFANCQANPIGSLLAIAGKNVEIIRCPPVHTITSERIDEVFKLAEQSDVVVHQPISDNFGPISSEGLQSSFSSKSFVSFPSIYFGGLFPQLMYLRIPGGKGTLKGPLGDYHDSRVITSFLDGLSVDSCLNLLETDESDYTEKYSNALKESRRRDDLVDIPVMDIIEDYMQSCPPLNTFNHPTTPVLWELTLRILDYLNAPIDKSSKRPQKKFLNDVTAMIPISISEMVSKGRWAQRYYARKDIPLETGKLIKDFYELYSGTDQFRNIWQYNVERNKKSASINR